MPCAAAHLDRHDLGVVGGDVAGEIPVADRHVDHERGADCVGESFRAGEAEHERIHAPRPATVKVDEHVAAGRVSVFDDVDDLLDALEG